MKPTEGIAKAEGLEPVADPAIWAERIAKSNSDVMLAGHLPHLGKLVGVLVNGDESKNAVNFQAAGMVKLSKGKKDDWLIDWMMVPSIV